VSLHAYLESREIERRGFSFYSLIMGAMRQADSENLAKLRSVFPREWEELQARYHAPGGVLHGENVGSES